MVMEDFNYFRFLPELKHMAATKIIGLLLRNPDYRVMMKKAAWDIRPNDELEERSHSKLKRLIKKLEIRVEGLPLPKALKDDLKIIVISMVNGAAIWLMSAAENTPSRLKEQYWAETVYELASHLQWNDFGCVNGRRTLESYVSNRETIDFVIWNQLCFHCMEDEIIRFAKTINWTECKKIFESIIPIYWYRKIYGESPTKRMYQPSLLRYIDKRGSHELMLDEETILRTFFNDPLHLIPKYGKTASAITYFRPYLKDGEEFDELVADGDLWDITPEAIFYLWRTMKGNSLFATNRRDGFLASMLFSLAQLPFTLFINDWVSLFEILDGLSFSTFFDNLGALDYGMTNYCYTTMYKPFEKVWRIFYRRFNSVHEMMGQGFYIVAQKNSVVLCKLMFNQLEDHQRILFIKNAKDCFKRHKASLDEDFSVEFAKKILKNDEEKKLFSEIPKK